MRPSKYIFWVKTIDTIYLQEEKLNVSWILKLLAGKVDMLSVDYTQQRIHCSDTLIFNLRKINANNSQI
jgi:hypothetical protein